MTPAQILAIISLLLAFNVPTSTVRDVQGILNNAPVAPISQSVTPEQTIPMPVETKECSPAPKIEVTRMSDATRALVSYSDGCTKYGSLLTQHTPWSVEIKTPDNLVSVYKMGGYIDSPTNQSMEWIASRDEYTIAFQTNGLEPLESYNVHVQIGEATSTEAI